MIDLRFRPKADFMLTADWQQLYILTEHWRNDVEFFNDEVKFMLKLVDKYFVWLMADEDLTEIQAIMKQIRKLEVGCGKIENKIVLHLSHITSVIENSYNKGEIKEEQQFREEHEDLEEELTLYTKDLRVVKKELFKLTEGVMETEKWKHLLHA